MNRRRIVTADEQDVHTRWERREGKAAARTEESA